MSRPDHSHRRRDERLREAWPALDSWQTRLTKGSVRVGDVERDDAAASLGEHFAAGRLDRGEYDERLGAVFAARTWGDLAPVFADLPTPGPAAPRARSVAPAPARRPFRLPLLPALVVLLVVAVATGHAVVFWAGLALLWWLRVTLRRAQAGRVDTRLGRGQTSGSRRGTGGSWS